MSRQVDPAFARKVVAYPSPAPPGTVIVDPGRHFLYLVQGGGQAIRYGVGVGGKDLGGRVRLPFTPNRNGRTGSTCNGATAAPPLTGAGTTPDPYAGVTIPSGATCSTLSTLVSPWSSKYLCDGTNTGGLCFSKNNTVTTLSPGTYCGGISISKGNDTVSPLPNYILNPGIYVLATTASGIANGNAGLTESGGTNIMAGTGVTLVFTSNTPTVSTSYPTASNPMMDIPGSMTLNLTAPTTGSTAGFVIMGDRSMPLGTVGQNSCRPRTGTQFVIKQRGDGHSQRHCLSSETAR